MAPREPHTVTVTIAIISANFSVDEEVKLELTATSNYPSPITIFTWPTILNPDLAQSLGNFTCVDLADQQTDLYSADTPGPNRMILTRARGGQDEEFFHTLEPNKPAVFSAAFGAAYAASHGSLVFLPDHRYRFGVQEGSRIRWWKKGIRDEIMTPEGSSGALGKASGKPIMLTNIDPIEFSISAPTVERDKIDTQFASDTEATKALKY